MAPSDDTNPDAIEDPTDPDSAATPSEKSFGQPERLRAPTRSEIADAIEATPTVEESRDPDFEVPSYLKKEDNSDRIVGTVAKGDATPVDGTAAPAGFTDQPSHDPTVKASSLSSPVIPPREAEAAPASGTNPLIFIAAGLAVVAVTLALLLG